MLKPTGQICNQIHDSRDLHNANPVMQIIGKQCYPFDSDAAKETQLIINAHMDDLVKVGHRGAAIYCLVRDVFLLGMIYGKREERRKRRERKAKKNICSLKGVTPDNFYYGEFFADHKEAWDCVQKIRTQLGKDHPMIDINTGFVRFGCDITRSMERTFLFGVLFGEYGYSLDKYRKQP